MSDKELAPTIYKQNLKFNNKTNNAIKKWAKNMYCVFMEEDVQMTNKHMKRCPNHYLLVKYSF